MKKSILLAFCILSVSSLFAQSPPYFSKIATAQSPSAIGGSTGFMSLRKSDGSFLSAEVGEGNLLEVARYDESGNLTELMRQSPTAAPRITNITSLQFLDGEDRLLVSGVGMKGDAVSGLLFGFFHCTVSLASQEMRINWRAWPSGPYTFAPAVAVTPDAIYGIYPLVNYTLVQRMDHNLNPVWNRGFLSEGIDTLWSKNPSMGGNFVDSSLVVTCKQQDSLGVLRISPAGDVQSYRRYTSPMYTRIYTSLVAEDGNLIMVGLSTDGPIIAKTTPDGTQIWAKRLTGVSGFGGLYQILKWPDGNYVAVGAINTTSLSNEYEYYVKVDTDGNLVVSGIFSGDFMELMALQTLQPYADGVLTSGAVMSEMDGSYRNVIRFTDLDFSQACNHSNLTVGMMNIDLGTSVMVSPDKIDAWDASLPGIWDMTMQAGTGMPTVDCEVLASTLEESAAALTLSPNPVMAGSPLQVNLSEGVGTLHLTDMQGRVLRTQEVAAGSTAFSTDGLAPGVYLLTCKGGSAVSPQRVVIQ